MSLKPGDWECGLFTIADHPSTLKKGYFEYGYFFCYVETAESLRSLFAAGMYRGRFFLDLFFIHIIS